MSDVLLGWVIPIVHIFSCLFLIVVVLLQTGKGADMGAVFGGGSQTLFGSGGAGNFLTRLTTATAIVFMLTSLVLTYGKTPTVRSGILDKLPAPTAAPEAMPPVPGAADTAPAAPGAGATAPAAGDTVPLAPQEPAADAGTPPAQAPVAAAPQAAPAADAAKAEPAPQPAAPAAQAPAAEPAKPAAKQPKPAPAKRH